MRLFFLVALTMCAFAANSILTRVGVAHYGMDAVSFAALRVAAGAVMLAALVMARGGGSVSWVACTLARGLGFGGLYARVFLGISDAGCGAWRFNLILLVTDHDVWLGRLARPSHSANALGWCFFRNGRSCCFALAHGAFFCAHRRNALDDHSYDRLGYLYNPRAGRKGSAFGHNWQFHPLSYLNLDNS